MFPALINHFLFESFPSTARIYFRVLNNLINRSFICRRLAGGKVLTPHFFFRHRRRRTAPMSRAITRKALPVHGPLTCCGNACRPGRSSVAVRRLGLSRLAARRGQPGHPMIAPIPAHFDFGFSAYRVSKSTERFMTCLTASPRDQSITAAVKTVYPSSKFLPPNLTSFAEAAGRSDCAVPCHHHRIAGTDWGLRMALPMARSRNPRDQFSGV